MSDAGMWGDRGCLAIGANRGQKRSSFECALERLEAVHGVDVVTT